MPNSYYSDPHISWRDPVILTDLEFINSSKLGKQYYSKLIVGDFNEGDLYLLSLNEKRDNILIEPKDKNLLDRVIDSKNEAEVLIFGKGFNSISDIKIGQDGFLYVLSF